MTSGDWNPKRDPKQDAIEGEVIAEYADHTLLNLPQVQEEEAVEPPLPTVDESPAPDNGRRRFISRVALGGIAALALGGSAALLYYNRQRDNPTVVVLPNGTIIGPDDRGGLEVADLAVRLNSLEAERDQLIAERDQLLLDLDEAHIQITTLQQMAALWQALDDTGLDTLVVAGLNFMNGLFAGLVILTGDVQIGLTKVRDAVVRFLDAIPGPRDGVFWLQAQVAALAEALDWLGKKAQEVVAPVEPYTKLIADFILWILSRLPFGAGERATAALEAMQNVVNSLPAHVEGLNTTVLDPLADWFGDNESKSLSGALLTPIDSLLLKPGQSMVDSFKELESRYQAEFSTPVQAVLDQRAALRTQLEELAAQFETRRAV